VHVPHDPPQPLSPQVLPAQDGVHGVVQPEPDAQVPPQPFEAPQVLPVHAGVQHDQTPDDWTQDDPAAEQYLQVPPQPSAAPHELAGQDGTQTQAYVGAAVAPPADACLEQLFPVGHVPEQGIPAPPNAPQATPVQTFVSEQT
jgi:hypothetical protein